MDYHKYLKKNRIIQKHLLNLLKNDMFSKGKIENFIDILDDQKMREKPHEFKEILRLIAKLSENNHRTPYFFEFLEQIILNFKDEIIQNFTNYELFNYFSKNKRLLLFLIENKILIPDQQIAITLTIEKFYEKFYPHYFFPEFSDFFDKKTKEEIENFNSQLNYDSGQFEKMRKIGENENFICQLIRNDSNDDFISFVNRSNLSLTATIESSIFETNAFLMKCRPTLIEYATFYGSVKIFKYLFLNEVKLDSSLWLYAIHGRNTEIIHLLEENNVKPPGNNFQKCLIESIKCHHNELSKYFQMNSQENEIKNFAVFAKSFQFNNYKFLPIDLDINDITFYHLCKNDYFLLVDFFLKSSKLNLNAITI